MTRLPLPHRPIAAAATSAIWATFAVGALGAACVGCGTTAPASPDGGSGGDLTFLGSGLGPDEIPLKIDHHCPGDPACLDTAAADNGQLYAGTARRDITPPIQKYTDTNMNGRWDDGEPLLDDPYHDGKYHPVWIAGYGNNRIATGIHDPTWVRCYALKQNQTTLAHCVIDAVGWFQNDAEDIRKLVDPSLGVDLVIIGATHLHETQDTVGLWGIDETTTGVDRAYQARIKRAAADALADAVKALKPAKMSIGMIRCEDNGDASAYISDTRDPVVLDNRLHVMQFDGAVDGKPIVTVVNYASHPESAGSNNHLITADYTYWLRTDLEKGTGSDVVFVNGALGGQIGPGRVHPIDANGKVLTRQDPGYGFEFAQAWGQGIARKALKAFGARVPVEAPKLAFWHTSLDVHVENILYHAAYNLGVFDRPIFGYDKSKPQIRTAEFDNTPLVHSEIAYITLGPAAIITSPGELLPENFLGGYDGSATGGFAPFIDMTRPNAADPARAPKAPYLRDMMGGQEDHRMVFGLAFDFLGYIVPRYNFVVNDVAPYLVQATGEHYEETNSVGPRAEPELVGTMRQLVMHAEGTKP